MFSFGSISLVAVIRIDKIIFIRNRFSGESDARSLQRAQFRLNCIFYIICSVQNPSGNVKKLIFWGVVFSLNVQKSGITFRAAVGKGLNAGHGEAWPSKTYVILGIFVMEGHALASEKRFGGGRIVASGMIFNVALIKK